MLNHINASIAIKVILIYQVQAIIKKLVLKK